MIDWPAGRFTEAKVGFSMKGMLRIFAALLTVTAVGQAFIACGERPLEGVRVCCLG